MDPLLSHFLPNLSFLRKNFSERNIPRRITFFSKECNRVTIGSTSNVSPLQFSVFIPFHWDSRWEDLAARNSKGELRVERGESRGKISRRSAEMRRRERERHGLCRKAAWQRGCCPRRHYGPKSLSTPGFPIPNPPTVSLLIAKCSLPYFASFFPLSFLQHWIAFIRNKREWKTWSSMMNFNQILQNKNSFYSCVLLLFEYDNRRWKIFLTFIILLFTNIY